MQRLYPIIAGLGLLLAQLACSDNGATDIAGLRSISQLRAWCGSNVNVTDACMVTP